MDGNLRSHIKGRAMIPGALGSGDKGKVRVYNGEAVADWRKVLNENTANSALPNKNLPNKISLFKFKRTIVLFLTLPKVKYNVNQERKKRQFHVGWK